MTLMQNAKSWLAYRRTAAQLRGLSTRTLSDIGLTRFDIDAAARGRHGR
jgi:uncharacterized protein YjiS (DUF1127 family)